MNKLLACAVVACALLCTGCTGCTEKKSYVTIDGFALGTTYHIVAGGITDTTGLGGRLDSLFRTVCASMSIYEPNSLLSRINRNETDSVDVHISYCIDLARKVSLESGGEYDVTVKVLTDAWGFGAEQAESEIPDTDYLLQFVGYDKIRIENGRIIKQSPHIQIDLNSVAKGYTVDLVSRLIEGSGASDYLVEVGGEVSCRGENPHGRNWTVGIDKPFDGNILPGEELQQILSLTNVGLATSGNYRRFYLDAEGRKLVHTINAVTGKPTPSNLLSATVVAENAALADAYGTMFMVIGLERSVEFLKFNDYVSGYLVYSDSDGDFAAYVSPRFDELIVEGSSL